MELPIAETTLRGSVLVRAASVIPKECQIPSLAGVSCPKCIYSAEDERVWFSASIFTSPTTPTTTRSIPGKKYSVTCLPMGSSLDQNSLAIDWLMRRSEEHTSELQ